MKSKSNEHKSWIKTVASRMIFLMLAVIAMAVTQNCFAQNSTKARPAQLFNTYYKLKDDLVNSHATSAAANADELVTGINVNSNITISNDQNTNYPKCKPIS